MASASLPLADLSQMAGSPRALQHYGDDIGDLVVDRDGDVDLAAAGESRGEEHVYLVEAGVLGLRAGEDYGEGGGTDGAGYVGDRGAAADAGAVEHQIEGVRAEADGRGRNRFHGLRAVGVHADDLR